MASVIAIVLSIGLVGASHAQPALGESATPALGESATRDPIFRAGVNLVRTDVIVRDANGAFIADLKPEDFIIEEDGVPQEVASLVMVNGGRVYNQLVPPRPIQEGIILPTSQQVDTTAGRVIILFIDELHLEAGATPQIRKFIKKVGKLLIHEGDLFGVISNGSTSVSVDLTYNRARLDEVASSVLGVGFTPRQLIVDITQGVSGPSEVKWRTHQAFKTVATVLEKLETILDRRKVVVYISGGYDLNPFVMERMASANQFLYPEDGTRYQDQVVRNGNTDQLQDPIARVQAQGAVFTDGDLIAEISELARMANRANTSFYTMDPRGLMAMPYIDYDVPVQSWDEYLQTARTSLRTLAELTGGLAIVNTNNFDGLLKQIDAESSDYYVLGFYASNSNPNVRNRQLSLVVDRPGATVKMRTAYSFGNIVGGGQ